ncbi:MAG: PadR family transcriptional regulator [Phycisphaerales bacterium]|jgi:PadR family transcriptional regulator PadR
MQYTVYSYKNLIVSTAGFMDFHNWRTQFRKGLLEFVVLALLEHGQQHGYQMVQTLKKIQSLEIREGNVYPILARLQTDGLIRSKQEFSENGPPRKYFRLTQKGKTTLAEMGRHWELITQGVHTIRKGAYV